MDKFLPRGSALGLFFLAAVLFVPKVFATSGFLGAPFMGEAAFLTNLRSSENFTQQAALAITQISESLSPIKATELSAAEATADVVVPQSEGESSVRIVRIASLAPRFLSSVPSVREGEHFQISDESGAKYDGGRNPIVRTVEPDNLAMVVVGFGLVLLQICRARCRELASARLTDGLSNGLSIPGHQPRVVVNDNSLKTNAMEDVFSLVGERRVMVVKSVTLWEKKHPRVEAAEKIPWPLSG